MSDCMSDQQPTLEDMRRVIREEMGPVWKRMEKHEREIYGHNGTPGLTTRVKENTTYRHRAQKHFYGLWTAVVGFVAGLIYRILGGT